MFINLSNHPSDAWDAEQLKAAREYGEIIDLPFPAIRPDAGFSEIESQAEKIANFIAGMDAHPVVHVMGEMTFTYAVVSRLKKHGIRCLASTTERVVTETPDGKKVSEFRFVRFREY